jgi:hypothetical protein
MSRGRVTAMINKHRDDTGEHLVCAQVEAQAVQRRVVRLKMINNESTNVR